MKTLDEKILELQQKVAQKKLAIKKAERPEYITNNAFPSNTGIRNILTVQSAEELVDLFSQLVGKQQAYNKANDALETNFEFKLGGYSYKEWEKDFKTRISVLQVSNERKKLNDMEKLLESFESEETKVAKQLEMIAQQLAD